MSNFTLFTSDVGSSSTGNAFDQDAFSDISLRADSNSGFSSTISSNPLNYSFANDDSVRYASKTLYIKDLVLVKDHALWVQGKPTYEIIWHENYPQARGYIFGNIQITRDHYITIRQIGDGIGITGVLRKCAFLVTGDTAATATAQLAVDGVNTSTVDFSNSPFAITDSLIRDLGDNKYNAFVNASSNQTQDIHDYRLISNQVSTLRLVGVIVYFQNAGQNVEVFNGTTYVNKNKVFTPFGATLPLPSYSGNLGGRALFYKNVQGGYTSSINAAPDLQSVATGSSGTNLLNVTTGTGASFPTGSGFAAFFGSTGFIGSVTNQSTDTLTIAPTLPFGVSGLIYKTWDSGQSLSIGSSLLTPWKTIDVNTILGFSNYISDQTGSFHLWGKGIGITTVNSIWSVFYGQNVSLGFIQVDGFFSGADVEFEGQGVLHATFSVNGFPAFGINSGQTGSVKKTIFTNAGPQWNSFNITYGASYSGVGINRINLYQRQLPQGISSGLLATLDTLPSFILPAPTVNATQMCLGLFRRSYADQLGFKGGWTRFGDPSAAGGINYSGFSTNCNLNFQYYGKNFAVLGLNAGQSMGLSIDGAAITGLTLNKMNTVASEGFHSVALTNTSGQTAVIHAIDFTRTQGDIKNIQNYNPVSSVMEPSADKSIGEVWVHTASGFGNTGNIRVYTILQRLLGGAISYVQDATGDYFKINTSGLYFINRVDSGTAQNTTPSMGISLNASNISVGPAAIAADQLLALAQAGNANDIICAPVVTYLKSGDIVRAHDDGNSDATGTNGNSYFRIIKIG